MFYTDNSAEGTTTDVSGSAYVNRDELDDLRIQTATISTTVDGLESRVLRITDDVATLTVANDYRYVTTEALHHEVEYILSSLLKKACDVYHRELPEISLADLERLLNGGN